MQKFSLDILMGIYDELTALGLYVVPKQFSRKIPLSQFWSAGAPVNRERSVHEEYQAMSHVSGWCVITGEKSGRLLVLDLDRAEIERHGEDYHNVYDYIQGLSQTNFVLRSPADGVHLYYRVPETLEMLTNAASPVQGVDVRGEGGQVVTLGGFNTYTGSDAEKKGVPSGHTGTYEKMPDGDYTDIPFMSLELYDWIKTGRRKRAESYQNTDQGRSRLEAHVTKSTDDRVRLVIECLSWVFTQNDFTYEEWYSIWMAAHHGSNGHHEVRDYILTHPNVYWRDGDRGRQHFKRAWDTFEYREGGVTVASLFWWARRNGWLTKTGYEIPDELCELISVDYISDWLDSLTEIPTRLLLQSQTGSGKTYTISKLWKRLGQPKAVVFVPSTKLAIEMATTLETVHDLPVTLYIDNEKGVIEAADVLQKASILVTTLQTFGNRVYSQGVSMGSYGLVYVEESDQLLQQFARGGGGTYSSHVSEKEARNGYAALREAFRSSEVVWCVDATMSMVTYTVAEALRGDGHIRMVRNTRTAKKAHVTMLPDKATGYLEVINALAAGKRVVVAADTAQVAQEVVDLAAKLLPTVKSVCINRLNERNPAVIDFMQDVNAGALKYQLVAYNSVMASGVSITSVVPDVLVHIGTYLTPRVNLQIINRYRKQNRVFSFFRRGENLYARKDTELLEEMRQRAVREAASANVPLAARTDNATLRDHVRALSVADEELQSRSPREFFISMLINDGRKVEDMTGQPLTDALKPVIKMIREKNAALKDMVAQTWHETPPVDAQRPAPPDYTALQVAQGEAHAMIERVLRGNIPQDEDPAYVFDVCTQFGRSAFLLGAFAEQEKVLQSTGARLADRMRALSTIMPTITALRLLTNIHLLFDTLDGTLSEEGVPGFMHAVRLSQNDYDALINRPNQKFHIVEARSDNDFDRAVDFSKILLSKIGLKQRAIKSGKTETGSSTYSYKIVNVKEARDFIRWRNDAQLLDLLTTGLDEGLKVNMEAMTKYAELENTQKEYVAELMTGGMNLEEAISVSNASNW